MSELADSSKDPTVTSDAVVWNWFALHSSQRMQLVSFWLAGAALLTSGLVAAAAAGSRGLAVGLSLFGSFASVVFARLDARTRSLILLVEQCVAQSPDTKSALGQLITAAGRNRGWTDSYRLLIQGLQLATAAGFLIFAVWMS